MQGSSNKNLNLKTELYVNVNNDFRDQSLIVGRMRCAN